MPSLSSTFQEQVLSLLVQETSLLGRVRHVLTTKMFDSTTRSETARLIFEYYDKYEGAPSKAAMVSMVDSLAIVNGSAMALYGEYQQLIQKLYTSIDDAEKEFVRANLESFVVDSRVQDCTLQLVSSTTREEYQAASNQLQEAASFMLDDDSHILDWRTFDRDSYLDHPTSVPVPLGLPDLDASIGGGVRPGQLCLIIGAQGVGKSQMLCWITASNFLAGRRVLFVSLEMTKQEIMMRLDACMTEQESLHIMTPMGNAIAQAKINILANQSHGDIHIMEHPMHSINVLQLKAEIKRYYEGKPFPDLIVVDYVDLFLPVKIYKDSSYEEQGQSAIHLKRMGRDFVVPVITGSQATRAAKLAAVVDLEHTAESMKKVHIADDAITMTRTRAHHLAGLVMLYTAKIRGAESGKEFYYRTQFQHSRFLPLDQKSFYDTLHYAQALDANHQTGKKMKQMGIDDVGVLNTKIKSGLGV